MPVTIIPIPEWARRAQPDDLDCRLEIHPVEIVPVRIANLLEENQIVTVNDLLNVTPRDLLSIRGVGEKTLETVYDGLETLGFYRPGRVPKTLEDQRQREIADIEALKASQIVLKALIIPGDKTKEGMLVRSIAFPWLQIVGLIRSDPSSIYEIPWRKWEEIIAGAYSKHGYEVILTPRSGDGGRDVIATKSGIGSIRIFDQVKAYTPPHVVTADEVRAMLGTITGYQNVSKGIITTTATFAPGVETAPSIVPYLPYRLELRPRDKLIAWLTSLVSGGKLLAGIGG